MVTRGLAIRICLPLKAPIQCGKFQRSENLVATVYHSCFVNRHFTKSSVIRRGFPGRAQTLRLSSRVIFRYPGGLKRLCHVQGIVEWYC